MGANCESECSLSYASFLSLFIYTSYGYLVQLHVHMLQLSIRLHFAINRFYLACSLTCQNGGTLNMSSCTCDCPDGYSGSSCESELQSFELTVLYHVHSYLEMEEYVKVKLRPRCWSGQQTYIRM